MANMLSYPRCDINDNEGLLWAHVACLSISAALIIASFVSQFRDPAPYGRHYTAEKGKQWGKGINQRLGHFISDALPGVPFFLLVYLLYAGLVPSGGSSRAAFSQVDAINAILTLGWLLHYLHRGWIHPFIMRYSSATVPLGITLSGIFPNCLFAYLIASQLACTKYPAHWDRDPRFIIGVILYVVGFVLNRWADWKLRSLRQNASRATTAPQATTSGKGDAGRSGCSDPGAESALTESLTKGVAAHGEGAEGSATASKQGAKHSGSCLEGSTGKGSTTAVTATGQNATANGNSTSTAGSSHGRYILPYGGMFNLVSCPNYLGELLQWAGYALACWSYPTLAWWLFGMSTFIPRALTHHAWYRRAFANYPSGRKALLPFVL